MFILATKRTKKKLRTVADAWFFISIFMLITGRIYEHFSHNIISFSMIYAFAYPLVLGCLVMIILDKSSLRWQPGDLTFSIYNCGVFTIMLGTFVDGVFEIYGAASNYIKYYFMVGPGLMIIAVILFIMGLFMVQEER